MKSFANIVQLQNARESDVRYGRIMVNRHKVTQEFINRLGVVGELDGHTGCVNCLEWSSDGRLLASGSDDVHICIWDSFRNKKLSSFATGHHGNVFSVKFIPNTSNMQLVSGAADSSVRVHDTIVEECFHVCTCHGARVKRIVTDPNTPHLFWSAGEDGMVLQHDLRVSHTCTSDAKKPKNVLINLKSYIGSRGEAKCLSVNPVRTELMAVGANDPYIRLYDRRMIKVQYQETEDGIISSDSAGIPYGAVQYFVPGHLPSKMSDYRRRYRSLASTYVEFSPDGTELLANLGGEQIYLFPLRPDLQEEPIFTFNIPDATASGSLKGSNGYTNGHRRDSVNETVTATVVNSETRASKPPLPPSVEKIKAEANDAFDSRKYARAIQLYNEALTICPKSAILLGNRAAALLKRAWDGDVYAALKDCCSALEIDSGHHKARLRYCRCLFELSKLDEAMVKFQEFKEQFPEYAKSSVAKRLEDDLTKAVKKRDASPAASEESNHSFPSSSTSSSAQSSSTTTSGSTRHLTRSYFFRFSTGSPDNSNSTQNSDSPDAAMNSEDTPPVLNSTSEGGDDSPTNDTDETGPPPQKTAKKSAKLDAAESEFRARAVDFSERYCGHCNTTTDIKEANFFGNYIVAGSDDGSFIIWDRKTTNIVRVLKGDESIVNCLQPHPSTCLLATSGIEQVVRLWAPLPEDDDGRVNDRLIKDWNVVASENQRRMNSNPFEMILMNMGFHVNAGGDRDPSDDDETSDLNVTSRVQCNQS